MTFTIWLFELFSVVSKSTPMAVPGLLLTGLFNSSHFSFGSCFCAFKGINFPPKKKHNVYVSFPVERTADWSYPNHLFRLSVKFAPHHHLPPLFPKQSDTTILPSRRGIFKQIIIANGMNRAWRPVCCIMTSLKGWRRTIGRTEDGRQRFSFATVLIPFGSRSHQCQMYFLFAWLSVFWVGLVCGGVAVFHFLLTVLGEMKLEGQLRLLGLCLVSCTIVSGGVAV